MSWLLFAQAPAPQPELPAEERPAPRADANEVLLGMLPWAISFLLHAGLVLLTIFIAWTVQKAVEEEEVIIPIARLSATPGAPLTMTKSKSLTKSTTAVSRRSLTARAASQATSALASKVSEQSLSISATMEASRSNPFDAGINSGSGLQARFFGTGGNAKKIAYLVDASGSLIDTLPFVILELKRSIGELSERQSFVVIFFQGEEAIEAPPRNWKRASAANKQKLFEWLDSGAVVPMGLSNPVKAMQIALHYEPQLMFLLSDNITGEGRYEVDQARLLADVKSANRGGTKINTIQFLYMDKLVQYGLEPTLKMISDETGGEYKFLDGRYLGIR